MKRAAVWTLLMLVGAVAVWRWSLLPPAVEPTLAAAGPTAHSRAPAPPVSPSAVSTIDKPGSATQTAPGRTVPAIARHNAPPPAEPPAEAVWDLCGIGRLPTPPDASGVLPRDTPNLPPHLGEDAQRVAKARLLAALTAGDERARAAAAVLSRPPHNAFADNAALLTAARGSNDPVVLAWALYGCSAAQLCAGVSLQDWVRREPDNATPWLLMWARRPEQRVEAQQGLARTTRLQTHWGALAASVLTALPADLLPYLQSELVVNAIGIESMPAIQVLQALVQACKPASARAGAAAPLALCEHLARVLLDHSDTVIGNNMGLRLAEWAGWPAAVTAARKAELQALQMQPMAMNPDQPRSCQSVAALQAWVGAVNRLGEVGAMRELAAAAKRQR